MVVSTTDDKAEARLISQIQHCVRYGAGCAYCSSGARCLAQFGDRIKEVMEVRMRFRGQEKHNQEFQLLLMFQDTRQENEETFATSSEGENAEAQAGQTSAETEEAKQTSAETEEAEQTSAESVGEQEWCLSDDSESMKEPTAKRARLRLPARARTPYTCRFLGRPVCRKALETLMGVSKHTVQRVQLGHQDLRRGRRARGAWGISATTRKDSVYNDMVVFLLHMYNSCGEGLPNRLKFIKTEGGVTIDAAAAATAAATADATAAAATAGATADATADEDTQPFVADNSSDEERLIHGSALWMAQQRSMDSILRAGCAVGEMPRRFLPPGKFIHLWWQYVQTAQQAGKKAGSYRTFMRACSFMFEKQRGILAFRKASGDHAKCTACEMFKQELRTASDVSLRASVIEARVRVARCRHTR